jgi:hypothetical protein
MCRGRRRRQVRAARLRNFVSICFRFSPLMSDFFQKVSADPQTNFKHVGGGGGADAGGVHGGIPRLA